MALWLEIGWELRDSWILVLVLWLPGCVALKVRHHFWASGDVHELLCFPGTLAITTHLRNPWNTLNTSIRFFIFFIQVEQELMFKNIACKFHKQCNKAIWCSVKTRTSSQFFIMRQGEYFILYFLFKSLVAIKWLKNKTKPNLKTALGGTWRLWLSSLLTREDTETQHYPKSFQPVSSKMANSLENELSRFWGWHIWVSIFLQTCRWSLSLCFICLCCDYSKSLSCQHVSQIKWTQELKLNQPWKVIWGR